jgi:hypothetical protein
MAIYIFSVSRNSNNQKHDYKNEVHNDGKRTKENTATAGYSELL